jgi:hypothetical protein
LHSTTASARRKLAIAEEMRALYDHAGGDAALRARARQRHERDRRLMSLPDAADALG